MKKLKYQGTCRVEFPAADDAEARLYARAMRVDFCSRVRSENLFEKCCKPEEPEITVKLQRLEQGKPPTHVDMD